MSVTRTNIGRIAKLKGAWVASTSYKKTNQVTAYGSTYQSLIDSNLGNAPYTINATTGKVSHANTDKWQCIADGSSAYNAAIDAATYETRIGNVEAMADSIPAIFEDATNRDFPSLQLLCGQPAILHGNGTPAEATVPYDWNQFDPVTGEGANWNGLPIAENQQYIDVSAASSARYIAVRSSYDKTNTNYFTLTWKNY